MDERQLRRERNFAPRSELNKRINRTFNAVNHLHCRAKYFCGCCVQFISTSLCLRVLVSVCVCVFVSVN